MALQGPHQDAENIATIGLPDLVDASRAFSKSVSQFSGKPCPRCECFGVTFVKTFWYALIRFANSASETVPSSFASNTFANSANCFSSTLAIRRAAYAWNSSKVRSLAVTTSPLTNDKTKVVAMMNRIFMVAVRKGRQGVSLNFRSNEGS